MPVGLRRRLNQVPVRWRLTAWYAFFLMAALLLFGIAMYLGLRSHFYTALDEQIEDQTALTLRTIQGQEGNLILYPRDIGDLENDEHFVRLFASDGRIVADTSDAVGGVPIDETLIATAAEGNTHLSTTTAGGHSMRIVTAPVMTRDQIGGVLQVGMSREEIDQALRALSLLLLLTGPVVLGVAATAGYALAGRAIAPVVKITQQAASISRDDLRSRLNMDLPDDELGRLAVTFDAMLDRIEEAFEQQRRFTGDAAHELRTPLSLMRGQVELALLGSRTTEDYQHALSAVQGDIERLTGLVGALLALARADSGQLDLAVAQFDLAGALHVIAEQFAARALESGIDMRLEADPCVVSADEDMMVQVIVNLVANAVAFTLAGGTVSLGCRIAGDDAVIWVSDTGIGIPQEHQRRVFDRFYRVGDDRSRDRGGVGLGLSISRAIVVAHGGRIELASQPGHGTTVSIRLPVDPSESAVGSDITVWGDSRSGP